MKAEELEEKKEKLNEGARRAIQDFEAYFNAEFADVDIELKLYRVEPSGKKLKKTFIERFFDIPSEETIGAKYGGGHFQLKSIHPMTGEDHSREVYIDDLWNKVKRERERKEFENEHGGGAPVHLMPGAPGPIPWDKVLSTFEKVAPTLKTIFGGRAESPIDATNSMVAGMQKIMLSGVESINKMQLNAHKEIQEQKREALDMESTKDESVASEVISMIKSFGEKYLEAKGPQSKAMETYIKNDPRFADMMEDDLELSAVYTAAINDSEIGKEKIDKLFNKLNIEVPADGSEQHTAA